MNKLNRIPSDPRDHSQESSNIGGCESPLSSAITAVERNLEELKKVVSTLNDRLEPVMQPETGQKDPACGIGCNGAIRNPSPIEARINAIRCTVTILTEKASEILDRLSV